MYQKTKWIDEVKDEHSEEIIQEGTDQSAAHFNNMELGIEDATVAAKLLLISLAHQEQQTAIERQVVTFTRTGDWPLCKADQTIALAGTRNSTDYEVDVDVIEHHGNVGEWVVTDKQLNGFKIKYDGSATSVKAVVKVTGGM